MMNKTMRAARAAGVAMAVLAGIWAPGPEPAFARPAAHAPIGVMGDHTHAPGEVMFSYRYMRMAMNGLRDGDDTISRQKVLEDFAVTPTKMDMEMHMFGAMVAPIERLTLMVMLPVVSLDMEHLTRTGGRFDTSSDGVGDFTVTALVDFWKTERHKLHANLGLSFPTGSITEVGRTPLSDPAKVRLPYPMQIGSGTYDFLPGLTYSGRHESIVWGGQARGEIRMNENHADYQLGNAYAITGWGAYEFTNSVSASLRLEWSHQLNINGRDPSINTTTPGGVPLVPTADPGRRASMRLDALAGVNFQVPWAPLSGLRFAFEAGLPTYQHYDGPALETDWLLTFGVQYTLP